MRLLDLYCCEGGGAMGYHRAGFDVVGVDLAPQRRYPFTFVQGDAIAYVKEHAHEFDVVHASPPCQRYSITNASRRHAYPDLIGATREVLIACGLPYVIENVPGAPMVDPLQLCGSEFGLRTLDDDGTPLVLQRRTSRSSARVAAGTSPARRSRAATAALAATGTTPDTSAMAATCQARRRRNAYLASTG